MGRFGAHPSRRTAVVTGASSGIGAATARALAAAGHPVVLAARRSDRCAELAAEIAAAGGEAVALPLDLASRESVDDFADAAEQALGPVEVLVSNAAAFGLGGALSGDPDELARIVEVNLSNTVRLVTKVDPADAGARPGRPRLRHLGRHPRPPAAHGRLRRLEVGHGGLRARALRWSSRAPA